MSRTALPADGFRQDERALTASPIGDVALISGVRRSDSTAFEALFRAYYVPLFNFAFRYLQSADEADDAVQTVYVRIWNARAEWHVAGTLTDYLYLAVRNACRDRLQRDAVARRWREKRLDELKSEFVSAWRGVPEADGAIADV